MKETPTAVRVRYCSVSTTAGKRSTGREWSDRIQIYGYKRGSFGCTGILKVQAGKLLYGYDRHDAYGEYYGKQTTAIQGVYITVKRKG